MHTKNENPKNTEKILSVFSFFQSRTGHCLISRMHFVHTITSLFNIQNRDLNIQCYLWVR